MARPRVDPGKEGSGKLCSSMIMSFQGLRESGEGILGFSAGGIDHAYLFQTTATHK